MYYAVQVRIPPNGTQEGYWKQVTPDDMTQDGGLALQTYMQYVKLHQEVRFIQLEIKCAYTPSRVGYTTIPMA